MLGKKPNGKRRKRDPCHGGRRTSRGSRCGLAVTRPRSVEGVRAIMKRLNHIREINALNGVAIVEANCILEDVRTAAAAAGLYFPLAIASQGKGQIGGSIACQAMPVAAMSCAMG